MKQNVYLLTGGAGFVCSNVALGLLDRDPACRVIVVDRALDGLAEASFAPHGSRVQIELRDITDPGAFAGIPGNESVTHVVHGAMVAHVPEWEVEDPARFVHVNIVGTTNVLEWARRLPRLRRLLYVSSGGVYGDPTPLSPSVPQTEEGPFNPPELYAISKLASELVCRRYGELFGLDVLIVRLSWVFGPMERITSGRELMSPPYMIARAMLEGRPATVTRRTLDAVGDFLSSEDVAAAIAAILGAAELRSPVYNIAAGELTTFRELLGAAAEAHEGIGYAVVDDDAPGAELDHDPGLRRARWNAYDIGRIRNELAWQPRPLAEQLRSYLSWIGEDPTLRCPPLAASESS
jgi:UDP-glucose 4-epimerase